MNQLYRLTFLILIFSSSSVNAAMYFYEASNVTGLGEITYGTGMDVNNAPVFNFTGNSGNVSTNLGSFTAGDYTLSFLLEGLTVDINNDGVVDFTQNDFGPDPFSITTGSFSLASLPPLVGNSGPLSWAIDPFSGGSVSYDFDIIPGPNSNLSVNTDLAGLDFYVSGEANGVMDAVISWDTLRVELNSVPEPSVFALFGLGLLGLFSTRRKVRS